MDYWHNPAKLDNFAKPFYSMGSVSSRNKRKTSFKIYMLFTGREVRMGKTVPEVLITTQGRSPRAVLKTKGTVFPHTDRPSPVNNMFIFFLQ